ncbi:MAG: glycine--tRNA ligase subunit beta [Candidatus Omnitrophica bacterium]|nr:glycine--tRNA ligase subunit beta [Candidatus Omnitrophota bacterium]
MVQSFLLEIGCEELPADYLPAVLNWDEQGGLASAARAAFEEGGLPWSEIRLFGTPRRLVLLVQGVPPVVERTEEGPPVQVAFDPQGRPTRAAESFAGRYGVPVSKLVRKRTARGERLVLKRRIPAADLLREAIPAILRGVPFPKMMRWDASGARFARPIRWLLALYGSRPVPCAYAQVRGGSVTYGSRRQGSRPVLIKSVPSYFAALKRLRVDLEEGQHVRRTAEAWELIPLRRRKRERLLKLLRAAARKLKGRLQDERTDEFKWLLDTVTFLAEEPVVAAGSFRPEYLALPPEVLSTSMAKHLKLFSVYAADGKKLLPKFLAVLEGKPKDSARVMANIERIIEARFTDARFFYQEDTKGRLEGKVPDLAKVVFHEKLGAVGDRIPRLQRLLKALAQRLSVSDPTPWELERAAHLCKADLVTQMVREFPSLQGTIGAHYAGHDGEPAEVVRAIAEQYRPRTANDPVPPTPLGAMLSLADRLDTLIGYFGVGLKPTGSVDPYGLRRQALGFVRILIEPPPPLSFAGLSIDRLSDEGIQSWGSRLKADPAELKKDLRAFLRERFEWLALVAGRFEREQAEAVLAAGADDLAGAWERLKILSSFWNDQRKKQTLLRAAKVAERTGRIVRAAKETDGVGRVDPQRFTESSERKLWEAWSRVAPMIQEQIAGGRWVEAVEAYGSLYPQVHEFFEKVFVMDENPDLRRNRLAFMKEIFQALGGSFADLSRLPLAEERQKVGA